MGSYCRCAANMKFKAATMTEVNEWVKTLWFLQHRHNPGQEVDYGLSQVPSTNTPHKKPNAVCASRFVNSYSSILYAPLSHPFKPSSWFEMLSLPTLIYVAILSVLQRPLLFFLALLLFFHHTHPAHSSTPIFIKATTALSASQNTQDRKTAFQGNSESQNHLGWKRSLEII